MIKIGCAPFYQIVISPVSQDEFFVHLTTGKEKHEAALRSPPFMQSDSPQGLAILKERCYWSEGSLSVIHRPSPEIYRDREKSLYKTHLFKV